MKHLSDYLEPEQVHAMLGRCTSEQPARLPHHQDAVGDRHAGL